MKGARALGIAGLLGVAVLAGCWSGVNRSPQASFVHTPREVWMLMEVTFDASASRDPDGRIVEYRWEFGDGGEGTGMTAVHVYREAGTFTVRLTVRDDRGAEDTAERTVTVQEVPLPPPPPSR